jgi:hypothetical protein
MFFPKINILTIKRFLSSLKPWLQEVEMKLLLENIMMKKKIPGILILWLTINFCFAQNLVPNPSFENYVSCPTTFNQIYLCQDWRSFGVAPDYYNFCGAGAVSVPQNNYGFQYAVTGNAYCGFLNCHVPGPLNDFIGAQLLQPLVIGQTYFVSLNVSRVNMNYCPTNKMGVLFSTVPFDSVHPPPRNDFAHVIQIPWSLILQAGLKLGEVLSLTPRTLILL